MEVITTLNSLKKYNSSFSKTVVRVDISRKNNVSNFSSGEAFCVQKAKENADIILVTFSDLREIQKLRNMVESENPFYLSGDKDICIQWCQDNNVDVVFWPSDGETLKMFEPYSINELMSWAITYYNTHNYTCSVDFWRSILYWSMIMSKIRHEQDLFKQDVRVFSWKEGYWRFFHKHFIENFTNTSVILLDPLKTEDNLFYRSNSSFQAIEPQRVYLSKLNNIILSNKSLISTNIEEFKQNVTNQINVLDSSKNLYVSNINIYYNTNVLENGKAFIELYLHVNNNFVTNLGTGILSEHFLIDV